LETELAAKTSHETYEKAKWQQDIQLFHQPNQRIDALIYVHGI
jgi:hypothetical protein